MKPKYAFYTVSATFILLLAGGIVYLLVVTSQLLVVEETLLAEVALNDGEAVRAYYIGAGATSNSGIVIVRAFGDESEKQLDYIEGYSKLRQFEIVEKNRIRAVVEYESRYAPAVDTFFVQIE